MQKVPIPTEKRSRFRRARMRTSGLLSSAQPRKCSSRSLAFSDSWRSHRMAGFSPIRPAGHQSDIFVEPFPPNRAVQQLSTGGGTGPRWSPTGTDIFYQINIGSEASGTGKLMRVPVRDDADLQSHRRSGRSADQSNRHGGLFEFRCHA